MMTNTRLIVVVVPVIGMATFSLVALAADLSSDEPQLSFTRQLMTTVQEDQSGAEAAGATATPVSTDDVRPDARIGDNDDLPATNEQLELDEANQAMRTLSTINGNANGDDEDNANDNNDEDDDEDGED